MRIYTYIFGCLILAATSTFAGDYPKSRDEKRAEEIGSILGGEGIVFRPSRVRNESTKTDDMVVNSFLWKASRDIIEDLAPISISDPESGIMSTEWYSDSKSPKQSLKIKVEIKGDVIRPESLQVSVRQKVLKKGRWLENALD